MGSGVERDRLVALAAQRGVTERIIWHGSVPQAAALLRAFDAFVLSSRTEGTPIALLEAMAAEVPIVATRVGGVPDVIGDNEGILVPSEDPAAIAQALESIGKNPEAARRRSRGARDRLDHSFGTIPWLDAIEIVYNSVRTSTP
jgi:glycosyltransferase involved in cell wall biosynthesis